MRHPAASTEEDREATDRRAQRRASRSPASAAGRWSATRCSARWRMLGLPADRDAARPRPAARATSSTHTIWTQGHARRPRRRRHPDQGSDLEIGDLVNAEPEVALRTSAGRRAASSRASDLQSAKAKAAVILVRMEPDDITSPSRTARTGRSTASSATPRSAPTSGCPISLNERTDPPPALPLPPVDLRPGRRRQGDLRPGRPAPAPAAARRWTTRATSSPRATSPNPSARASGSVTRREHRHEQDRRRPTRTTAADRQEAEQGRRGAPTWADDRARPGHGHEEEPAQGLPRPLVVHARRDRAVELRRPAADRRVPDPVVQAEHGRGRPTRAPTTSCAASRCPRPTPRR